MPAAGLRLDRVGRTFVTGTPPFSLRELSLEIPSGGTLVVLGPSGSGKTTLLRIVAGLERPDTGRVWFDNRDVTREPPERRSLGFVFAKDALFEHLSAARNIAYGVQPPDMRRVRAVAERMHVGHLLERGVRSLSGGERQRVALARALAREPALLLLDEPLGRLDAPLRATLRRELGEIFREAAHTSVLVTHDQSEAMSLGDRVALLRDGCLEQIGTPRELFDRPANRFVAAFIGSPAMAFVPAGALPALRAPSDAVAGLRADAVELSAEGELSGIVRALEDFGSDAYVEVELEAGSLVARVRPPFPRVGERVAVRVDIASMHLFDASGVRLEPAPHG